MRRFTVAALVGCLALLGAPLATPTATANPSPCASWDDDATRDIYRACNTAYQLACPSLDPDAGPGLECQDDSPVFVGPGTGCPPVSTGYCYASPPIQGGSETYVIVICISLNSECDPIDPV